MVGSSGFDEKLTPCPDKIDLGAILRETGIFPATRNGDRRPIGLIVETKLPGTGKRHVIGKHWNLVSQKRRRKGRISAGTYCTRYAHTQSMSVDRSPYRRKRSGSTQGGRGANRRDVSIPFIAGQWSLLAPLAARRGGQGGSLNPLHCGAVVASIVALAALIAAATSQSPSLRGSGRFSSCRPPRAGGVGASQSPSLRGSGRFAAKEEKKMTDRITSQSPSLRGSGRFGSSGVAPL